MKNRTKGAFTLILFALVLGIMAYLCYNGVDYKGSHLLSYRNIKQGLDLKGGVNFVFEAQNPKDDDMIKAESIIRRRLDSKNYTEATVSIQGANRLRVEIPDVDDADAVVADIGKTAQLLFTDVEGNVLLTGSDVVDASYQEYSTMEGSQQVRKSGVSVTFNKEGTQKFSAATKENIGKPIYIVLDDDIISAPRVEQQIDTDTCSITGVFTMEEAAYLATLIKSGALPVPMNVIEMSNVGAQLGSEALAGSLKAGLIGSVLVLLFMLAMYRLPGLAADIALVFFVLAELLFFSLFRITLTLPGIAGMILTIGMAVDANVIIFERMKEEIALKKTIRTSLESGFNRALPAILDGNITTLIAACVLFMLGTGPIKGFAQTLILGVIISMFTALLVTRALLFAFYWLGIKSPALYSSKPPVDSAAKAKEAV